MSARRSQRITLSDVRDAYETLHECRELWADPAAWQTHVMNRATEAADCKIGLIYEVADSANGPVDRLLSAADVGWEMDAERKRFADGVAHLPLRASPLWARFADDLSAAGPAGATFNQDRYIHHSEWHASSWYDDYVRPTRLGQGMLSGVRLRETGTWSCWCLANERRDGSLTLRQQRVCALFHRTIAPAIGTTLCTWRDRSMVGLTPLRRRVLEALLEGMTERAIARAMFRTISAVHQHVRGIYTHFGVSSRAELSAYFLRRRAETAGRVALDETTRRIERWFQVPTTTVATTTL